MRHFKFCIPIAGAFGLLFGATGCADENPWGNATNEKGGISVSLTTDSDISTAKPIFRSGENAQASDPKDLNTYITVPAPEDFSIRLVKADGSFSKTWKTVTDFENDSQKGNFSVGSYTLTAFYGEKGTQDFEAPYFEASETFNVLADQTHKVNLTAELKNSMVKINYTDGFKNYMKDYHANIQTSGKAEDITYGQTETRPAFLEPNNAKITVHFTTASGFTTSHDFGEFAPVAKTLHNITFDIKENDNGFTQLGVIFDETLEDENIYIDLTDELLTSPIPAITCEGFNNGDAIDMLAGVASQNPLKMNVYAAGTIDKAVLTIESNQTMPWGNEIDLCSATAEQKSQMNNAGLVLKGFTKPTDKLALLDLTNFNKFLGKGKHTISLTVTDKNGAVSTPSKVTFDSQDITIDVVGEPAIVYGSGQAVLTLDYNGLNPDTDVSFQAINDFGQFSNARIISCEESTGTRAFDVKRYIYVIELPNSTRKNVEIKVFHGAEKKLIGEFNVPVTVPEYTLAYDAFSQHALVKVVPESAEQTVLSAIVKNIDIRLNGNACTVNKDAASGIITITGLTPETSYTASACVINDGVYSDKGSFTTENELPIPNGDFTARGEKYEIRELQVGGQYRVSPTDYTIKSSFSITLPYEWATINTKTAWSEAKNQNTWFVVPSSWLDTDKGEAVMRTVGYNHDGKTPAKSGGAFNTKYYCENAPSDGDLLKAAGEVFLGTYLFNGVENRTDGTGFSVRPTAISFDYNYSAYNGDKGYAYVKVLDSNAQTIAESTCEIPAGEATNHTLKLNYNGFGKKAATLVLGFKSSNKENPEVKIPSGSELNEGFSTLGNKTKNANDYKALATGSVLRIDNVKAIYGTPASTAKATKRNSNKR